MRSSEWRYLRRLAPRVLHERGLLSLTFVFGVVGFAVTFVYPWLIGQLIDDVMIGHGEPPDERVDRLMQLVALAAATALLFAVAGYGRGHFNMKLGNRIVTRLRRDLFDHFQRLSLHFHTRHRSGSIVNKLVNEVHAVATLTYHGFVMVLLDALQLLLALALMFTLSARLTLAVLVVLPMYVVTFKLLNPRVRRASEDVHAHLGYLHGNMQEQFANVALIKSYAAEARESDRFGRDVEEHYRLVVRQSHVGHLMGAASELWVHLGTTVIIALAGYIALTDGRIALSPGELTAFLGYTGILYGPLKRFSDLNLVYQNSMAGIRRVFRAFDIAPHITEKPDAVRRPPALGRLTVEGVRFSYEQDTDETRVHLDTDPHPGQPPAPARPVLDDVWMDARPGQRVALVGPSGSGKTTLASLLVRLYDPDQGRILLDGVDLRDYALDALRTGIAVVQQESFIFSGTVRDNILYGRPGASEDDVVAAAKAANAHEFITRLPQGYGTVLGERGVNLSGGQKQRLSIARAILKDPSILILDEATSALDTQSERLVQQALDRLMLGRTSIIIAHRLSTIRNADRIVVMNEGRVVEAGTHHELLEAGGLYARLVTRDPGSLDAAHRPAAEGFTVGPAA